MYAVIETGGKQYRVEVGTELEVELLEVSPGDAITLDRVLLIADGESAEIGRPIVPNATVAAEVLRQTRGEKVISFKYRPKARRRVKKGHRQELTVLRISDIVLGGRSAAADAARAVEAKVTERQRLEAAARRQAEADAALAAKLAPVSRPKADLAAPAKPASSRKAKAATKAKATPKAKAAAKPKATPKAKAAPKAKATPKPAPAKTAPAKTAPAKTAPAATNATKPRTAKATSSESITPDAKPKRASAPKKDE